MTSTAHVAINPPPLHSAITQLFVGLALPSPTIPVPQSASKNTTGTSSRHQPNTSTVRSHPAEFSRKEWKQLGSLDVAASPDLSWLQNQQAQLSSLRQRVDSTVKPVVGQPTERVVSAFTSTIKDFFSRQIQPLIADIWNLHAGRSFTVENGQTLPKVLEYASVPKEKVGKVFSFEFLKTQIQGISGSARPHVFCGGDLGEDRIVITRKNSSGGQTRLEFDCRRPGVVNVYLNGKRMQADGKNVSLYTDDALKLAKEFANGEKSLRIRKPKSNERVIGHAGMYQEAEENFRQRAARSRC